MLPGRVGAASTSADGPGVRVLGLGTVGRGSHSRCGRVTALAAASISVGEDAVLLNTGGHLRKGNDKC